MRKSWNYVDNIVMILTVLHYCLSVHKIFIDIPDTKGKSSELKTLHFSLILGGKAKLGWTVVSIMAVEKCMKTEEVESEVTFSDTSKCSYHTRWVCELIIHTEYVMYLKPVSLSTLDLFTLFKYIKETANLRCNSRECPLKHWMLPLTSLRLHKNSEQKDRIFICTIKWFSLW